MTLRIRIASRKSNLAIRQVEILKEHLSKDIDINIIEVVTSGDKILDKSLADIGGKGLFIKELENTILKDKADVAVHSMKDMETELAANTKIAGVLPRGSRSDVLLGEYSSLDNLPDGAVIGTSSVRRGAFAKSYRPDLQIKLLRGNVGTRIDKLNNGVFDAIILAKAGLDRLNIDIGHIIPKEIIPPASTQGIIAVQSTTNKKTKLETDLYSNLLNFYREHKDEFIDEFVAGDFIKSEIKGSPSTLFDLSTELRSSIHESLQEPLENWSQIQLEPTFVYGIREYKEGAILVPHRDRDETHIVSAIINIDKEVSEDWPLVIEDHNQKKHEVFLDPGEVLFYESAKLLHGRPYPLKGKSYSNIFCHYKPLNLKSQT